MRDLFTAENSTLLLIDHQVGTMQLIKTLPLEVVRRHTLALAKTAHSLTRDGYRKPQEEKVSGTVSPGPRRWRGA
jgi:hypothetical protein